MAHLQMETNLAALGDCGRYPTRASSNIVVMAPDEAVAKARTLDCREGGEFEHLVTLENGQIVVLATYPNPKHIGCGHAHYFFDQSTGELIRKGGGK